MHFVFSSLISRPSSLACKLFVSLAELCDRHYSLRKTLCYGSCYSRDRHGSIHIEKCLTPVPFLISCVVTTYL